MENQMTIGEVRTVTAELLAGIEIPVALIEKVGVPVSQAIANLNQCLEAIRAAGEQKEETTDERAADAE